MMYGKRSYKTIPKNILETYAGWDKFIATIWYQLISHFKSKPLSSILEVAPGSSPKMCLALSKLNFAGNVFLVDPCKKNLSQSLLNYQTYLPLATITTFCLPLDQAIHHIDDVDMVISHSPIDDMILTNNCYSESFLLKLFDWTNQDKPIILSNFKKRYDAIFNSQSELEKSKAYAFEQWNTCFKTLNFDVCIMSQYPSLVLKNNQLDRLNQASLDVLQRLKQNHNLTNKYQSDLQKILNQIENFNFPPLGKEVLNAKNWLVYQKHRMN